MAKEKKTEKTYFNLKGMSVSNVRRLAENVLAFTLSGNGLGLYGLKVVTGKKGEFIAPPQIKGKDGEYYNQYSIYFTEEDEKKVIEKVEKSAPAPKENSNSDF